MPVAPLREAPATQGSLQRKCVISLMMGMLLHRVLYWTKVTLGWLTWVRLLREEDSGDGHL